MQGHEHTNSHARPTRRSRQERDRNCLALYVLTVALETPAMLARYFVTFKQHRHSGVGRSLRVMNC